MKIVLIVSALMLSNFSFSQKSIFFRDIDFDSSYTVIGIGQHFQEGDDSLPGFWFILDNLDDLIQIKKDWVFKNQVNNINLERNSFDIFIIRDKRTSPGGGIIFPRQGIIKSETGWYKFDTAKLNALHRQHPLKYHTQTYTFDTYTKYAAFGNSLLNNPSLLFFFEPALKYEGKFVLVVNRSRSSSGGIFAMHDLNKQLADEFPRIDFTCSIVEDDEFNKANTNKVKITVECPKSLYDRYKNKYAQKGEWQPSAIAVKTFWRD